MVKDVQVGAMERLKISKDFQDGAGAELKLSMEV